MGEATMRAVLILSTVHEDTGDRLSQFQIVWDWNLAYLTELLV